jgi:hypothetical protein
MLLQIFYLSLDYFSYPFNIKLDINYDKQQSLPSLTLCTSKISFISKTQLRDNYPRIHRKVLKLERHYRHCSGVRIGSTPYNQSVRDKCLKNYHKYNQDFNSILKDIRNRNRINTTLEQLFDKTLHLNEFIDCKIHFKDGRIFDCLEIYSLFEVFDGLNFFGKCFVYSNENQIYYRNKSKDFSITKDDYIEFKLNNNFIDIMGYYYCNEYYPIYLSVHSPNTSVANVNYKPFHPIVDNFKIDFSKTTYKSLEWPYNTDCHHYNHNELYHSRESCLEYCHLKKQNLFHGCLAEPSAKRSLSVSNRRMNSELRHIQICNDLKKSLVFRECQTLCKRDCYEVYYEFKINTEKRRVKSRENWFFIRINANNLPVIEYSAISKYSFILYMTSVGGLMSLWIGISAIDLKAIFEISVVTLQKITTKLISICSLNEFFNRFVQFLRKFAFYLKIFKKFDWKKITTILSFICFIYQLIELTLEYTEFKTTIHVDLVLYSKFKDNPTKSYINPSFSLCIDGIDYESDELTESQSKSDSKVSKPEFPEKFNETIIKGKNISEYLSLAKNEMPLYMRCLRKESDLRISGTKTDKCIDRKYIIMSLSNLGKCFTYLSRLSYSSDEELVNDIMRNSDIFGSIFENAINKFYTRLIHDQNQLPSLTFTDFKNDFSTKSTAFQFKRLPPPYDSNCFDYKKSQLFRSRGHCINDCLINKILKKYNCIPKESENILTFYDNISLNSKFCDNNSLENLSQKECIDKCLKPCEEILFISNPFKTRDLDYVNNIYMTFIYFMTSIGGLLGLWNNLSVYDLQLILIKILGIIINLKVLKNLSMIYNALKISKLFDFIKTCNESQF